MRESLHLCSNPIPSFHVIFHLHQFFGYHATSTAARSPTLSSRAWSLFAFRRSYHPLLLRSRRMFVMAFISIHVGVVDEDVATAGGARFAERVKGAGVLINFASCSLGKTGTGPSSSETWKSRMKVCLNQDRSRWKNAGLCPKAGNIRPVSAGNQPPNHFSGAGVRMKQLLTKETCSQHFDRFQATSELIPSGNRMLSAKACRDENLPSPRQDRPGTTSYESIVG